MHPLYACRSRIGMGMHKADAFAQHLLAHDGVRIQKENILRLALTDGDIVGSGKTIGRAACREREQRSGVAGTLKQQILQ